MTGFLLRSHNFILVRKQRAVIKLKTIKIVLQNNTPSRGSPLHQPRLSKIYKFDSFKLNVNNEHIKSRVRIFLGCGTNHMSHYVLEIGFKSIVKLIVR